jgi:hypothetical protein
MNLDLNKIGIIAKADLISDIFNFLNLNSMRLETT